MKETEQEQMIRVNQKINAILEEEGLEIAQMPVRFTLIKKKQNLKIHNQNLAIGTKASKTVPFNNKIYSGRYAKARQNSNHEQLSEPSSIYRSKLKH